MTTPSKGSYENAKETVKKYEERQSDLKFLHNELSKRLNQFSSVNFKIDKKKGTVIFAGSKKGKTYIGQSEVSKGDKFEPVIGKLIAVKRSLHEDTKDVEKFVESDSTITFNKGGIWSGGTLTISSDAIGRSY